ncbi:MAG: AAA family ATPase [Cyclobacteriaceae bacterium]|nr:AAA family ATPase [Cyclobacteriaceae bacterium]
MRIATHIKSLLAFEPTASQQQVLSYLNDFLDRKQKGKKALMIKGYAGTGKTTLLGAIVKALPQLNWRWMLMAPTGRAAKVMSQHAGTGARTIHKSIYRLESSPTSNRMYFRLQKNNFDGVVFIVDEASMIQNQSILGGASILDDLVKFVFMQPNNRLIIIGDTAQLPPVGEELSQALDIDFVSSEYDLDLQAVEMTEVVRQTAASGILYNATHLRQEIAKGGDKPLIQLRTSAFKDMFKMTGERIIDGLRYAYDKYGEEETVIVTRSNFAAVQYNRLIRFELFYKTEEIESGDRLMVVKNNYHFLPEDAPAGFIANGDFLEVRKIISFQELYGFRFADLVLAFSDGSDEQAFEAKVILDTLHSKHPALSAEEYESLFRAVEEDYLDIEDKKERRQKMKQDPYLNALQIKFAYALTCHKSQGGQWDAVFVDQGYLTEDQLNLEYMRWLYTAITRSKQELFLLNFHQKFFAN